MNAREWKRKFEDAEKDWMYFNEARARRPGKSGDCPLGNRRQRLASIRPEAKGHTDAHPFRGTAGFLAKLQ